MIRRYVFFTLTLAAVLVLITAAVSDVRQVRTPLLSIGHWRIGFYAHDAIARVLWFRQHEPMSLELRPGEMEGGGDAYLLDTTTGLNYRELPYLNRVLRGPAAPRFLQTPESHHGIRQVHMMPLYAKVSPIVVTVVWSSMWTMFAILAAYPAVLWIRASQHVWRWRSRKKRGLCQGCGYDLTGNQSGTCPECGTAVRVRWKTKGQDDERESNRSERR